MRKLTSALLFLVSLPAAAQQLANTPNQMKRGERSWERSTIAPLLTPHYPLLPVFTDRSGTSIPIDHDFGVRAGLRWEQYAPNRSKGFAIEVDFGLREFLFEQDGRFFFSDRSIGLTPILSWKAGKFEKDRHPFIELGIQHRLSIRQNLDFANTLERANAQNADFLRTYRAWAYLGVGIKNDLFNQDWSKIQMSSLRLGVFIPLFDQANIFQNRNWNFPAPLKTMELSYYHSFIPTISYLQMLNLTPKTFSRPIPYEVAPKNKEALMSPSPNWNKVQRSRIAGTFYTHFVLQQAVDSLAIEHAGDTYSISLDPSWGWRAGYTLHFLGNHKKYHNPKINRDIAQQKSSLGFRWNAFAGVGILTSHLRTQQDFYTRYHLQAVEGSGGLRFGVGSIFVHGGYTRRHNLTEEAFIGKEVLNDFSYARRINDAWFMGLSLNNSLVFRVYYQDTYPERMERRLMDNLFFSFGFGL